MALLVAAAGDIYATTTGERVWVKFSIQIVLLLAMSPFTTSQIPTRLCL